MERSVFIDRWFFPPISIRKFSIECYLTIGNIFGHFPPSVSSSSSDDLGHHHSAEIRHDTALSGKGQWRKIYDSWLFLIFTMMSFEFRAFKGSNKAKIGLHSGAGNTQYVWDDRVWMVARSTPFCDTKIRWQCCWISFPDICPDQPRFGGEIWSRRSCLRESSSQNGACGERSMEGMRTHLWYVERR